MATQHEYEMTVVIRVRTREPQTQEVLENELSQLIEDLCDDLDDSPYPAILCGSGRWDYGTGFEYLGEFEVEEEEEEE